MAEYRQKEKNAVRSRILSNAITALTVNRNRATIVREDELALTVEWFLNQLQNQSGFRELSVSVSKELEAWLSFHRSQLGTKEAKDLRVLYLCGPEPLNDLDVMIENGINTHNVWAITSSADKNAATEAAFSNNVPLKIHCGGLANFFDQFNESFDIIYFDACGPFCGGSPNTLEPLMNIFQRERLRSPGVLITNFCQPASEECDARNRMLDLISSYFAPRYRDLPRFAHQDGPDPAESCYIPDLLRRFTSVRMNEMYSEFVTRLIVDLAMNLIPNWRALSLGAFSSSILSEKTEVDSVASKAKTAFCEEDGLPGEMALSPSSYPLVSFLNQLAEYRPNDPVLQLLAKPKDRQGRNMLEIAEIASMISGVIEGHWLLLNDNVLKAVKTSWFDYHHRITCDVPLPNLTLNSLLGTYGRPWFANPRLSDRITYQAKVQRMFCDLIVFDQCRPFFDWFPVIEAVPSRFKGIAFQIVARCIMDRIGRHNYETDTHPFRGASVTSVQESSVSGWYNFADRSSL